MQGLWRLILLHSRPAKVAMQRMRRVGNLRAWQATGFVPGLRGYINLHPRLIEALVQGLRSLKLHPRPTPIAMQ